MPTASPNGTYKIGPGASVTDARGVVYAINADGQITVNGKPDLTTGRVDALGFYDGLVWQKNADNFWYSKSSATATWANYPPGIGNPMPVPLAVNNNGGGSAHLGGSVPFWDTHGNQWRINAVGQVEVDGKADPTTRQVIDLQLVNGRIWQENTDGVYYFKAKPSDAWSAGTRANPALAAEAARETWVGGHSNTMNSPLAAVNWSKGAAPTPDRNLYMTGGVMNLGSGNLGGDTLTLSGQRGYTSPSSYQAYLAAAPTINMSAGAVLRLATAPYETNAVKVNVAGGRVSLDVRAAYPGTSDVMVTADRLSSVLLSGGMAFGRLVEHGGTVLLNNSFAVNGTNVLLDSSLGGAGTFQVGSAQSSAGALEVTGSLGTDVTLAVHGDPGHNAYSAVTLDNGLADHGTVTLNNAYLYLKNLGALDGMSYRNSVLSLFRGNTLVETVKVSGVADPYGGGSNGVLSFAYSAGTLTVHDGGVGTITGLARHA